MLVRKLGWSLADIDMTDTVSLMDFIQRMAGQKTVGHKRKVYCDQVRGL